MKETRVVNISDSKDFDIYIGRYNPRYGKSKWANPYKIGIDGDRNQVVEMYKEYLLNKPELLSQIEELRGKRLGCYCEPERCHGHVLIELLKKQEKRKINEIEKYEKILALELIKEHVGNKIDPEKMQIELDERLNLIKKELHENAIELLPLDYCVLCGSIMKDRKRITRRIHDIIFHIKYYKEQMNI